MCTGNSVEKFVEKFAALAESVGRMALAGRSPRPATTMISACVHEPDEDHIRCRALLA